VRYIELTYFWPCEHYDRTEARWWMPKQDETCWNRLRHVDELGITLRHAEPIWDTIRPTETAWNKLKETEMDWHMLEPIEIYSNMRRYRGICRNLGFWTWGCRRCSSVIVIHQQELLIKNVSRRIDLELDRKRRYFRKSMSDDQPKKIRTVLCF
jgi:hypothetical protein